MSVSPLKVNAQTKERVRLGAAIMAVSQGQFVDDAVAEYIERHAGDLRERAQAASKALLGGDDQVLAFLRGEA